MGFISNWGERLANSQDFYFYLALAFTIIFAVQFIMALLGGVGDHDMDADFSHDLDVNTDASDIDVTGAESIADINFFTLKSITAFIMFFGWAGFFWGHKGWIGLLIAIGCGLLMMFLTSLIIFLMLRMQQSGNINSKDIKGKTAVVYLRIPGGQSGTGKITIKLNNCTREAYAMSEEEIERGTPVIVTRHLQGNCYLVMKLSTYEDESDLDNTNDYLNH